MGDHIVQFAGDPVAFDARRLGRLGGRPAPGEGRSRGGGPGRPPRPARRRRRRPAVPRACRRAESVSTVTARMTAPRRPQAAWTCGLGRLAAAVASATAGSDEDGGLAQRPPVRSRPGQQRPRGAGQADGEDGDGTRAAPQQRPGDGQSPHRPPGRLSWRYGSNAGISNMANTSEANATSTVLGWPLSQPAARSPSGTRREVTDPTAARRPPLG